MSTHRFHPVLPTNLQNFMQKDSTKVKIFQNVSEGYFFLKHPVYTAIVNSSKLKSHK